MGGVRIGLVGIAVVVSAVLSLGAAQQSRVQTRQTQEADVSFEGVIKHTYLFTVSPDIDEGALAARLAALGFLLTDEAPGRSKLAPLSLERREQLRAEEEPRSTEQPATAQLQRVQQSRNPCSGLLARVIDVQGRGPQAALAALAQLSEVVFGPDPETDWDTGVGPTAGMAPANTNAPPGVLALAQQPPLAGAGVVIAVLDTGVNAHAELAGRLYQGYDLIADRPLPSDRFDDPQVFPPPGSSNANDGHGTPVAARAAGSSAGVAPAAEVLPLRVCSQGRDGRGRCLGSDVVQGVCYALVNAPRGRERLVLNLSLGGPVEATLLSALLAYAADEGTVVVAAGGNEGKSGPTHYPAATPIAGLLAVAALAPDGTPADFTTRGSYLDLAAVGDALTLPAAAGDLRTGFRGSSFAAPVASGVVAAVRAATLAAGVRASPAAIERCLLRAAAEIDPLDAAEGVGVGRLLEPAGVAELAVKLLLDHACGP